ncbi:acetyl-CoA carboxylase biotin carboxyl carrier protein [Lichenicoccus roseus]|uniref:Biotin carboxyl carrier protein of acetyl-CoA carboxylase n=1 Tax=Lichenicoccus roseus TaxID=2683649 RepID=A0A5R9JFN8_9PROT|nr:acetyl-CoA carboxylase biotin carboxyl carrier protein subunit [Lichenicoccus roseus]TLU74226.1 acetyl-CoA carboxylase biotin carboxyl carrier protein [Lichenicoccus roseus]
MSRLLLDAETIRALADILTETGLTEIEIAEKDSRIRVARAPATVQAFAPAPVAATPATAPTEPVQAAATDPARHPGAVKSPMVGIAYLSPEPSAPAFVVEGQQVAAGQTLMLIEAMKTFNQIKAPRAGTLRLLLVASGAPVEFDEVLAVID